MPKANLYNMAGEQVGEVELSEAVFGIEPNEIVLHAAVKNHLANLPSGHAERSDQGRGVRHHRTKPWRQKGTGRARAGLQPRSRSGRTAASPLPRSRVATAITMNKQGKAHRPEERPVRQGGRRRDHRGRRPQLRRDQDRRPAFLCSRSSAPRTPWSSPRP